MSTRPLTAALLAIGDEVLRGEVINSNGGFLGDALFDLGFVVQEHRVISDDVADIRATLMGLSGLSASGSSQPAATAGVGGTGVDVLISTGGLGPTDDDRTVDVVSGLLPGAPAPVIHEPSRQSMERAFAARNFALTPNNLRQVRVPAGAMPLPNAVGLAPGFRLTLGQAQAFFLPGIPREMQRIFADHIRPFLIELQAASGLRRAAVRTFHVYGMGESHMDHRLAGLIDGVAGTSVHYRTAAPENHLKLVVRGPDAAANQQTLDRLDGQVRERLGNVIYGVDDDSFALAVARGLNRAGATLALAESCTGGYAGQILTSEAGSSAVFRGGVVAYHNDVKQTVLGVRAETLAAHGAVSEPCAAEMAEGVRRTCGATLGVSITGIAGSAKENGVAAAETPAKAANVGVGVQGGPDNIDKPVGMVCFGIAGPRGTRTETKQFFAGRERIRRAAAYFALDLARRYFED